LTGSEGWAHQHDAVVSDDGARGPELPGIDEHARFGPDEYMAGTEDAILWHHHDARRTPNGYRPAAAGRR